MGVNGFELLKESVLRGFATVMLTAHALSSEALEKSARLGAVSFLPKENIFQLKDFLEDVVEGEGRPVWRELFDRLGDYFLERFGTGWKKKEMLLRGLEGAFRRESRNEEDKV